ncbi:MAG: Spy/CpxP family protein refolding chaperone [Ferruginibacter sp.]
MNIQSKSKIVILVIGLLLVANIILLSFFLLNKPDRKRADHKSPMSGYLQNEIGFNDEQMAVFETIKTKHRSQAKGLFDKMRANKELAFKDLGTQSFSDSAIISAATYAAMQQKELEIQMLQHLKDIRNICTPQQRAKFDSGFYKIMSRGKDHRP